MNIIIKKENGITLISLIVTIIILLILVCTTNILLKNGVIDKAKQAVITNDDSYVEEQINLGLNNCEIDYISDQLENNEVSYLDYVYDNLNKYLGEFQNTVFTKYDNYIKMNFSYNENQYNYSINMQKELINNDKNELEVGKFLNYPVRYYDLNAGLMDLEKSWVIIDDGVMENTSGKIKVLSYGVVGKVKIDNGLDIESYLGENFINNKIYTLNCEWRNACDMFQNEFTEKVSVLSLNELKVAYNAMNHTNDFSSDGNDIFCNEYGDSYYLSTLKDSNNLYMIMNNKISSIDTNVVYRSRNSVKVVVTLKNDVRNYLKVY